MKYHVTVGDRSYEVEVDGEEVLVDGHPRRAELRVVPGTPIRHLILDRRATALAVIPGDSGKWVLLHRGEAVSVEVVDERTRHIRGMLGSGKRPAGGAEIKAPMPGLVVRVSVEPGQAVVPGQGLVILEAMKMENELKAVAGGVVESVRVVAGQAVEKGAVLVVLT